MSASDLNCPKCSAPTARPARAKVYVCNECGRSVPHERELQPHLHWHRIGDKDVRSYFTEHEEDVAPPAAAALKVAPEPKPATSRRGLYAVVAVACVAALGLFAFAAMRAP
jgi:hypothetical protein